MVIAEPRKGQTDPPRLLNRLHWQVLWQLLGLKGVGSRHMDQRLHVWAAMVKNSVSLESSMQLAKDGKQ